MLVASFPILFLNEDESKIHSIGFSKGSFFKYFGNGAGSLAFVKIMQFWYILENIKKKMNDTNQIIYITRALQNVASPHVPMTLNFEIFNH